jgi:hypothetical protein
MSESTWLERFYTHFLGRDLAYTFAGGLFICVGGYTLFYTLPIPKELSPTLIGFFLSSYFLGFAIRDIGVRTFFPFLRKRTSSKYKSDLIFHQDLIRNYDSRILDRYERTIYYLAICTSVGTSSLLSGGFLVIVGLYRWFFQATYSINNIGLAFGLVLLGFSLVYNGRSLARFLENEDIALAEDILSKN